ncbi:MAG: hypothetical protein COA32_15550 [Fluviicola sp.]|nr:MAG: hypothetical protein COA32_15550 [Fluviicola sp.]
MRKKIPFLFCLFGIICLQPIFGQEAKSNINNSGWFSLGGRSTISLFDHDGAGIGTGGSFRVQLTNKVNTDWFADYITINQSNGVRSEYAHVGWSVMFYPFEQKGLAAKRFQPYIVAGHCFDYNNKTIMDNPTISRDRWGSAVQAGLGFHFNITERFDISLTSQYMIHLTPSIELDNHDGHYEFHEHSHNALEGHLLTTVSINYKIFKIWKR